MTRGRKLLLLQLQNARHPQPPLGPPPKYLNRKERRAWVEVVAVAPDVLRAIDQPAVAHAVVELVLWRSGHRERSLRLAYAMLGDLFIPMRKRRRLLFPDRAARP
jgi:hypothetical protein